MSYSFDRVADLYDATRGFPSEIGEQVADAIAGLVSATPETRFLEPGIGTGRVALPLVRRGYSYTGVDVSERMMDRLRHKLEDVPNRLKLVQADATSLPFEDGSFDVALTVHLLHLIPAWREAMAEICRVLRPDGLFLNCSESADGRSAPEEFEDSWREILAGYGVTLTRCCTSEDVCQELRSQGAELEMVTAAQWQVRIALSELLDRYAGRVYSSCWQIPEEVVPLAVRDVRAWARERYDSEDEVLSSGVKFDITVARHWASV